MNFTLKPSLVRVCFKLLASNSCSLCFALTSGGPSVASSKYSQWLEWGFFRAGHCRLGSRWARLTAAIGCLYSPATAASLAWKRHGPPYSSARETWKSENPGAKIQKERFRTGSVWISPTYFSTAATITTTTITITAASTSASTSASASSTYYYFYYYNCYIIIMLIMLLLIFCT